MQSSWDPALHRQIEKLRRRVGILENLLPELRPPERGSWQGNLRGEINGVTCPGKLRCEGGRIVISLSRHHRDTLERARFEDEPNGEKIEICAVIRLKLPEDIQTRLHTHWMTYKEVSEWEPTMLSERRHKYVDDGDGTVTSTENVRRDTDHTLGLEDAMEGLCVDSTIEGVETMLCRMCLRKGDYLRLYLSKGWNEYLIKGQEDWADGVKCSVDICSLVDSDRLEELNIPMRCKYQRIDDESGKRIRILLPSWFRTVRGGKTIKRPEFNCKILHAYRLTNGEDTVPNSTPIQPQAVIFKKSEDRNELRYPMIHNIDEKLPLGYGLLDLQLRL